MAITQYQHIESRFGGRAMLLKIAKSERIYVQLVAGWARSGVIPDKYWLELLFSALNAGIPLTPFDFVAHVAQQFGAERSKRAKEMSAQYAASPAIPPAQ